MNKKSSRTRPTLMLAAVAIGILAIFAPGHSFTTAAGQQEPQRGNIGRTYKDPRLHGKFYRSRPKALLTLSTWCSTTFGEGKIPRLVPITFGLSEGLAVGRDPATPVTESYQSPFEFNGKIRTVVIEMTEDPKQAFVVDSELGSGAPGSRPGMKPR